VKRERDNRYTAFLIIAALLIIAFFAYNHGHIAEPWSRVPDVEQGPFPGFPVDINSADAPALMLLPGVGRKTAEAILAEREKKGGFSALEDIEDVRGIGEEKFKAIRRYIIIKKYGKKGVPGG